MTNRVLDGTRGVGVGRCRALARTAAARTERGRGWLLGLIVAPLLVASCGGGAGESPPAESPEPRALEPSPDPEPKPAPDEEPAAEPPAKKAAPEPKFEPGMTVEQAIGAVPSSGERLEIEQDILSEPLLEPALYEPCKLRASDHFTVRVAIWNGKAVGLDITTKPKNEKLATCLREQIIALEWREKVASLNTVEYSH